jgi:hypothetical protein
MIKTKVNITDLEIHFESNAYTLVKKKEDYKSLW